jgi:diadenosine tetraphosphatase ApaH/serine/threonine PP2A family protein phosphatase
LVSGRLEEPARALLAGLPTTVSLDGVLYCHGSPRSDEEILTRLTPEPRLRECLVGVEESLVVCGHTHVQFDRLVDSTRVVNAGSVGIAYEGRQGAFWAVIEAPLVELRHTVYHVEAAVTAIRSSGYPDAEQLAQWLLEPVDPDETSSYFESIA